MATQEENAIKLIKSLKRRKNIDNLDIFIPSRDNSFFHYFSISGFLNDEYFSVYIMESKKSKTVEIDSSTDCKEEIKKILVQYNLM